MYYELYIDILFLENLVLDYLLLCLVRQLLGCATTQLRLWLAAGAGSLGLCILCGTSFLWTVPGLLISYVGLSTLMVQLGFHLRGLRPLAEAVALLYGCSLLLGGIIAWIQELSPVFLLPAWVWAALALGLLELLIRCFRTVRRKRAVLLEVTFFYGGVRRHATGLWDTGNHLYDPLHGKPVCVVEKRLLEPEISGEELLFQIPYHSLGKTDGMLPAVIADSLSIQLGDRLCVIRRPVLGLTEEPLSCDGSYDLILNPDVVDS